MILLPPASFQRDDTPGRYYNAQDYNPVFDPELFENNLWPLHTSLVSHIHFRGYLIQKNNWAPLWIVDFPLFEKDEKQDRLIPLHHPFTSPKSEDIDLLNTNPEKIRSVAYDIVMNGYELGGGSIRIHDSDTQKKIFDILGISDIEAEEKFGFLMNAFKYGAPPHGGMAFGFDRIVMLLAGSNQIRDVIAFPKTTSATSLMDNSPSNVDSTQLDELGLNIKTD